MKDIYVIKVKTKPPLSSLYPSERRYSASTVGGLSLVHLGLSILAFLLGTLAKSLQGPVLSFACLVPFISGLLAWRRWYIDKNISFFFYGSLFSLIVSILCGIATVFDIASVTESGINPTWKFDNVFKYPEKFEDEKRFLGILKQNNTDEPLLEVSLDQLKQDTDCNDTFSRIQHRQEEPNNNNNNSVIETVNCTEAFINLLESSHRSIDHVSSSSSPVRYFGGIRNGLFSFWREDSSAITRTNLLLDINVLVTCVLEIAWSLLSVKISLRGMRNHLPETSYDNNERSQSQKIKQSARNPATQDDQIYSRDDTYEENLRNFGYGRTSVTDNSGPRLPLPESNKEFRERVERFLANQAAHRIVEGSCS